MLTAPRGGNTMKTDFKAFIDPNKRHLICSVYPRPIPLENHNGSYTIPGKPDDAEYGSVPVRPGTEKRDHGGGSFSSFMVIEPKAIAEDFIGIPQGDTQYTDKGIFVPEGDVPTPGEIAAANERLMRWAESQVGKADISWAQKGNIRDIADDSKIAAKLLKLERKWADSWKAHETVVCPACGEALNKNAKIHAVGQGGCGERIHWTEDGVPYWPETDKGGRRAEAAQAKAFSPPPSAR